MSWPGNVEVGKPIAGAAGSTTYVSVIGALSASEREALRVRWEEWNGNPRRPKEEIEAFRDLTERAEQAERPIGSRLISWIFGL